MKRKVNKKKRKLFLLLILVLLVSVGYALLSTTLNINGTTKVKNATWNIYWDNANVTDGSVTTTKPTIDSAKTTASFNVELEKPGDFYEFTIDAKNDGTIDGMISNISYKLNDTEIGLENPLPAYLNYTVTYSDDVELAANHLLAANAKETYKVRVEFKKNIENNQLPGQEVTLSLKFAVTYVQSDNNAVDRNESAITYITRQNEGQITPGDVIGIGETEDFYVISSDSTKTVLLAKYNLLVGYSNNESTNYEVTYITPSTPGYGLQNVDAVGYVSDYYYSTVAFSATHYWDDGNGTLLSPYNQNGASYDGNPYPFVYNSSITTQPDFSDECDESPNCFDTSGYSIAHYVEQYVTTLKGMGAPSTITGRLLTYEEADSSQSIEDNGTSIILNDSDYWLGSAGDSYDVWRVWQSSFNYDYYYHGYYGVRPVIEIPTSEIR